MVRVRVRVDVTLMSFRTKSAHAPYWRSHQLTTIRLARPPVKGPWLMSGKGSSTWFPIFSQPIVGLVGYLSLNISSDVT